MTFTDDEKIALGAFCELVLQSEQFAAVTSYYETSAVQHLLSTKPQDRNGREETYHAVRGVRDFLALMGELVKEKNRLTNPVSEPSDFALDADEDA